MNQLPDQPLDSLGPLRRGVYWILIALATGNMVGRILAVNSVDKAGLETYRIKSRLGETKKELQAEGVAGEELDRRLEERRLELEDKMALQRPFLSSNDRSRWATVRSLVEHGTYAIDDIVSQPNWDTIDMVKHKDRQGQGRLYSSKPPLLATLLAGPYWLIHRTTGTTLGTHPYEIGRPLLMLVNVLPLVVAFWLLGEIVEQLGGTDWGRIFVMACATLGTFLTTFAVVINNHLVAMVSTTIALYALLRIWRGGARSAGLFVLAGVFAAFAAANELPALAFFAIVSALVFWKAPRPATLYYLPAALVVVAAFFATNYIAHNSFKPPYAHWSQTDPDDNWYEYTYMRGDREITSYWVDPSGIDRGEECRGRYALHMLVGHHGIFSLTPVWLLSLIGAGIWILRGDRDLRFLAAAIVLLSAVVVVFYIFRPEMQRNYGGMTSGLRWMFWFAPLWLTVMLPAADAFSRKRPLRIVAALLLVLSVVSVSFPTWNPWTHPWITKWFLYQDWIEF